MLRVLTGVLAVALRQLLNNRSLTFMVFFAFSVKENFYVLPFSFFLKIFEASFSVGALEN